MTKHFQLTIYIAGPMTGLPDYNYPAFFAAAKELADEGHAVLNPAKNTGNEWADYMRASLRQIASADGMFMLKGWETSKGARIEHQLAKDLGMRIRYQEPKKVQGAMAQNQEAELKSMQEACASTSDLGRELRKTEDNVLVSPQDLRMVLGKLRRFPPANPSPSFMDAFHRLQAVTPP